MTAMQKLRHISSIFHQALDIMPLAVLHTDSNGRCLYANSNWEAISGKNLDETLQYGWTEVVYIEDRRRVSRRWYAGLATHEDFEMEFRLLNAAGHIVWVLMTIRSLIDPNENHTGYLCFFRDVSEKKRLKSALRETENSLEAATMAREDFLNVINHELKTPMNGIVGVIDLLNETPLNDEQKEFTAIVRQCADFQLSLIHHLLDYMQLRYGVLFLDASEFFLDAVLKRCADELSAQAHDKGLGFHMDQLKPYSGMLIGDTHRIRQIFIRIGENAVKFTSQGEIRLAMTNWENRNDAVRLYFEISDTGEGIPEELMATLFHPFRQGDETLRRQHGGVGLGLAIAKDLIRLMNGDITLESIPGQGTRVKFTLTLHKKEGENLP